MAKSSEYLYGIHTLSAVLEKNPHQVLEFFMQQDKSNERVERLAALAKAQGVSVHVIKKSKLDQLADFGVHQGVLARVVSAKPLNEQDLIQNIEQNRQVPFLLALEGVTDPHNLGACLRSCDAAGVTGVILPRDKSVKLTATVRKVASGAAETIPVYQTGRLASCLQRLKEAGVWSVGTLLNEKAKSLFETTLTGPLVIVMGSEDQGLSQSTIKACDALTYIPMQGVIPSLNVSVATGVCLYEALRQRSLKA